MKNMQYFRNISLTEEVEFGGTKFGGGKSMHSQQGAVLFIGLILLLGVTLLSISGIQSSVFNQRLAENAFEDDQVVHWGESAGYYGVKQSAWVNKAMALWENKAFGTLLTSPSEMHDIENFGDVSGVTPPGVTPPDVKVGLVARKIHCNGCSAGADSGISTWIVEAHGLTDEGDIGGDVAVVQGFKVIGAGK